MGTILIIILILLLVGAVPNWHGGGPYLPGGLGLVLVIVLILVIAGYIH